MKKIISVIPTEDFQIIATFSTNEKRIYDIKPLLDRKVFSPLRTLDLFNAVHVVDGAVSWTDDEGNEIDICPDKLYEDSKPYVE